MMREAQIVGRVVKGLDRLDLRHRLGIGGRLGAEIEQRQLRIMVGRPVAAELRVQVDRVILRLGQQPAGDQDMVQRLRILPSNR